MYKTEQFAHLQCLWCQPVMFAQFCSGYITSPSNQNTSSCHQVPLSQSCPLKGKHPSHFAEDHSLPEVRDRNHHCILFKEPYWRRKKRKGKERKKRRERKGRRAEVRTVGCVAEGSKGLWSRSLSRLRKLPVWALGSSLGGVPPRKARGGAGTFQKPPICLRTSRSG